MFLVFTLLLISSCSNDVNTDSESEEYGCDDPQIKGNLTTYNGEKIYHVPGGQFYDVTDAEEYFCTEEEAEEAGYRKSLRLTATIRKYEVITNEMCEMWRF